MTSAGQLQAIIKEKLDDRPFVLVSNREPYSHVVREGKVECTRTVGGVVRGLEPIILTASGIWVAHGSGNADRKVRGSVRRARRVPKFSIATTKLRIRTVE